MTDFARLFAYDSDANQRLLDALRAADSTAPGQLDGERQVFAHLVTAKQVWRARLKGLPWTGAIWPDLDWDACADLVEVNRADYAVYFEECSDDLDVAAVYHNSRGQRFETARRDILMHLLIHGGYHRGQLARALREAGHAPPNTDYITHVRQGT
ncbi:MAG: DinB family protein [Bacteroidota bacterium]